MLKSIVFFIILFDSYIKEIQHQLQQNNSKWYRSWCICLQLLDTEIPRSATILNQFLGIVEPALRSTTMDRRAEAYLCWKVSVAEIYFY